jgi:hypothetical protein
VHVGETFCARGLSPGLPSLRDRCDLLVAQLGERAKVPGRVHDDLLPLERGIEIRYDARRPFCGAADAERLRRSAVLPSFAERALVELCLGWFADQTCRGAGPATPVRRDGDEPPREWVSPKIQSRRYAPWPR